MPDKTPMNEEWLRTTEDSLENQRLLPTHEQSRLQLECLERKKVRKTEKDKRELARISALPRESKVIQIRVSPAELKKLQLIVDYLSEKYGIDTNYGAIRFCIGDFIDRNKLREAKNA